MNARLEESGTFSRALFQRPIEPCTREALALIQTALQLSLSPSAARLVLGASSEERAAGVYRRLAEHLAPRWLVFPRERRESRRSIDELLCQLSNLMAGDEEVPGEKLAGLLFRLVGEMDVLDPVILRTVREEVCVLACQGRVRSFL